MSFITFLLNGPTASALENLTLERQLPNIPVEYGVDREPDSLYDDNNPSFTRDPRNISKAALLLKNDSMSMSIDFSPLFNVEKTWKSFLVLSAWIRNTSLSLSLSCLGVLYWKHIPGRSLSTRFNLITGIVGVILASVARLAHLRHTQVKVPNAFQCMDRALLEINNFRTKMIQSWLRDNTSPFLSCPLPLKARSSDFFTINEIFHVARCLIISEEGSLKNAEHCKDLYQFFATRDCSKITSNSANFLAVFSQFTQSLDKSAHNSQGWAEKTIQPYIDKFSTPSRHIIDEEISPLFAQCYKNHMNSDWQPTDDDFYLAFGQVYKQIRQKFREDDNQQKAIGYLNDNTAMADFEMYLYASGFQTQFKNVFTAMEKQFEEQKISSQTTAKDWIENQAFFLIPLEQMPIREAFMGTFRSKKEN